MGLVQCIVQFLYFGLYFYILDTCWLSNGSTLQRNISRMGYTALSTVKLFDENQLFVRELIAGK